jgi:hypothetical protein
MKPKDAIIMTIGVLYMIAAPIFALSVIVHGAKEVLSGIPEGIRIFLVLIISMIGMGILYGYDQIRDTFMLPTWLKIFYKDDNDSPKG